MRLGTVFGDTLCAPGNAPAGDRRGRCLPAVGIAFSPPPGH